MVKKKSNVWKHWTILARNLTENQDDQTEEQIEDQVENQTETQAKDQIEDNKPHPCVKCKYCPKIFERGIATRMQAHLDATSSTSVPSSNASRVQKWLKTIPISNFADM
ncbi:14289_t:CDS:2, partial [Dentiscutata heterogama]